jgi:iron-sulfur cluster assembly protein
VLAITQDAIDAIKTVTGPGEGGLRISTTPYSLDGEGPGLTLVPAPSPAADDAVVETEGTRLYLDEGAAAFLDGKVLDADEDGDSVRFSVFEQP